MRIKIRLDTMNDILHFVAATSTIEGSVVVVDNEGHEANAKSLLRMVCALEYHDLWCVSDQPNLYSKLSAFMTDD